MLATSWLGGSGMQFGQLKRREFITLLGSAATAWPLAARAQQTALPVIGFLNPTSPDGMTERLRAFRQGLKETGYVEDENVLVEYGWAEGQYDRLPAMAAELVRRRVAVIVAIPIPAAIAAKSATAKIPIVFYVGGDPVELGLVASLNRPGGNATGVNYFVAELGPKQLELLHELLPTAVRIGLMVNPTNVNVEGSTKGVTAAAATMGLQIDMVQASDSREIEAAFATLVRNRADALVIGADPFFTSRRLQLATLATRHAIPAITGNREFVEAGGLMSYGTSLTEAYRQLGAYTGRILKGAKPNDLPVMQSIKFELVINLPTARALGIEIPPTLLARADEVIE
jgi:putative tryptophan/tyrosine transport system substrate-binding protein